VVVGHPRSRSRKREAPAQHADGFAEGPRMILEVPNHLQDERLSTVEAERGLRAAGVGGRDRRRVVDQAAATVILQSWLDGRR
jgi:putative Holliday junction resolvase